MVAKKIPRTHFKPRENPDFFDAGFFPHFTANGFMQGFSRLNMAFGQIPMPRIIVKQKILNLIYAAALVKNNRAGRKFLRHNFRIWNLEFGKSA